MSSEDYKGQKSGSGEMSHEAVRSASPVGPLSKAEMTRSHISYAKGGIGSKIRRIFSKRRPSEAKSTTPTKTKSSPNENGKIVDKCKSHPSDTFSRTRGLRFWENRVGPTSETTGDRKAPAVELRGVPTPINGNHKLDVDTLITIFAYYATHETVEYPIETLLLVCRAWNQAALGHCALWGYFRIHIAHIPSISRLARRVKLRLERSGDTVPLYIELRDLLYYNYDTFVEAIEYCELEAPVRARCRAEAVPQPIIGTPCRCQLPEDYYIRDILTLLTGPDGLHCSRWRSLILDFDRGRAVNGEDPGVASCLQYPTPSLVSLTLQYISIDSTEEDQPLLPYNPNLRELALDHCFIPSIPNTTKLEFAGMSWPMGVLQTDLDALEYIESSTELKVLKLNLSPEAELLLPPELPWLWRLDLRGSRTPCFTDATEMPSLTHLAIGVCGEALLADVNRWIPLAQLTHLQLWYEDTKTEDLYSLHPRLCDLLRALTGIETLTADVRMMSFVLKAIWEDLPKFVDHLKPGEGSSFDYLSGIFARREVVLCILNEEARQTLSPRPDRLQVTEIARNLGVICPEEEWDFIYERFGRPWVHP